MMEAALTAYAGQGRPLSDAELNAVEINDLYDESPLEDRLWAEFKRLEISAERQEFVSVKDRSYALDFAVYCSSGKIDVETDGDTWHADPERIPLDNQRDNDLETVGWRILRFNTYHVQEKMAGYCLPTVVENIQRLGGVEEGKLVPRRITLEGPDGWRQLTLFEPDMPADAAESVGPPETSDAEDAAGEVALR